MPEKLTPQQLKARRQRKKRWYRNHTRDTRIARVPVRDVQQLSNQLVDNGLLSWKSRRDLRCIGEALGRIIEIWREEIGTRSIPYLSPPINLGAESNQGPTCSPPSRMKLQTRK
ncbi:MAG: hypothetical protein V4527_14935 [Pseudomonadota bacterium]